jgi:hypothetical protein
MRRSFDLISRAGLLAATAAVAACSSSMPDFNQFRLPSAQAFLPSNSDTYVPPASVRAFKPVGPQDLVDRQGLCAGMVSSAEIASGSDAAAGVAPAPPTMPGAVGLDMSECEVVRAVGQPQMVDIGTNERGERRVMMTYSNNERAGTYQFVSGRLTSLERGPEPPAPPKPEKPAKKKPASAKPQSQKPPAT